jgi:hypothetical protein
LFFRQSRRRGHPGVSALEFAFALRRSWNELEFLLCRGEKIRHHRHISHARRRLFIRLRGIARFRRPGINRRLGEHVVVDRNRFVVCALGRAQVALLGDPAPIRRGHGSIFLLRVRVLGQRAAILRHCSRGGRRIGGQRCHRRFPSVGCLSVQHLRRQDDRCRQQISEAAIERRTCQSTYLRLDN